MEPNKAADHPDPEAYQRPPCFFTVPVILSLLNHRDGSEAQASQDDVFYQLCNTSIKVSMEAASNLIAVVYVAVTGQ